MKKLFYIAFAAAALAAVSCAKNAEFTETPVDGEQALVLNFTTGSLQTRTVKGVDNENLVKRIDYFFFPYKEDGKVDPNAEYAYKGSVIPGEGHELEIEYRETISPGVLNKIFPDGNKKAVVMAIANYVGKYGPTARQPETTIPEDAKTWQALHELEVGPTFFKDGGSGFGLRYPRKMNPNEDALFFVMAADSVEVALNTTGQYAIDAEVPLKRLASKVTVQFTFEECIDKGIKWVPQYQEDQEGADEARVYLSNAIEHTTIGGPLTRSLVADSDANTTQPSGNGNRDIFEYAYDFLLNVPTVGGKKAAHYYTYPISMEKGDHNQPYLKLVLPWYGYVNRGSEEEPVWVMAKQKEVYYKIVLPHETISDPNMIYEYDVKVNIVGNEKEVQITGEEYRVKDWSSDQAIDNNVGLGRYISLDIPKSTYDMYGSEVQILYVSSGEVEISDLEIYTLNYSDGSGSPDYYINGNPTQNASYIKPRTTTDSGNPAVALPDWVSVNGTQLVINHTLNTNINSSDVDIAPYYFVVTLHLKGVEGDEFDRTVTITQYPPIYVSTIQSARNTVFLNGVPFSAARDVQNNHSNGVGLGNIGGGSYNNGETNTVVTVTTLSSLDATTYVQKGIGTPIIGDPLVLLSSNYPTDPNTGTTWGADDLGEEDDYSDFAGYMLATASHANYIAPKFMIASVFGSNRSTGAWLRNAERCAAYQENGYPAGRWRLPTEAEMFFIWNLGNKGLIPQPFNRYQYWSNTGRYFVSSSQTFGTGNDASVRCVYDLWYWGDEPALTTETDPSITEWSGYMTTK